MPICHPSDRRRWATSFPIPERQGDGRGTGKIHVGFVHDDDHVPVVGDNVLHEVQFLINGRRRVGIGKNDSAVFFMVILLHQPKLRVQVGTLVRNPIKLRPHLVKRIGNVGKKDWFARIEKGKEAHGQHVVGTDPDEHLVLSHPVITGQGFRQIRRRRIWIEAKPFHVQIPERLRHLRGGGIRVLICI